MSYVDKAFVSGVFYDLGLQSDWEEEDTTLLSYVKNKPTFNGAPLVGDLTAVDLGLISDVQIADESIVEDGVATIPNFVGGSSSSLTNKAGLVPKPPALEETGQWRLLSDVGWIEAYPQPDSMIPWANKYSPNFTGSPTAPTASQSDDSTRIATTAFVHDAIDAIPTFSPVAGSSAAVKGLVPGTSGGHASTDDIAVFTDEGWESLSSYFDTSSKLPPKSYAVADYFQKKLVSGTSIKTINNNSILGSGNIDTVDAVPKADVSTFGKVKIRYGSGGPLEKGFIGITGSSNFNNGNEVLVPRLVNHAIDYFMLPAATTSTQGAMSASDKTKLDGIETGASKIWFGTCDDKCTELDKTVVCSGFTLTEGVLIAVLFTDTGIYTQSGNVGFTMNVNATGAKGIRYRNSSMTLDNYSQYFKNGRLILFRYDGEKYVMFGDPAV